MTVRDNEKRLNALEALLVGHAEDKLEIAESHRRIGCLRNEVEEFKQEMRVKKEQTKCPHDAYIIKLGLHGKVCKVSCVDCNKFMDVFISGSLLGRRLFRRIKRKWLRGEKEYV